MSRRVRPDGTCSSIASNTLRTDHCNSCDYPACMPSAHAAPAGPVLMCPAFCLLIPQQSAMPWQIAIPHRSRPPTRQQTLLLQTPRREWLTRIALGCWMSPG